MATSRIYKVSLKDGEKVKVAMVRAKTSSQAVRLIIADLVKVRPATTDEVATHMEKGGQIKNVQQ